MQQLKEQLLQEVQHLVELLQVPLILHNLQLQVELQILLEIQLVHLILHKVLLQIEQQGQVEVLQVPSILAELLILVKLQYLELLLHLKQIELLSSQQEELQLRLLQQVTPQKQIELLTM